MFAKNNSWDKVIEMSCSQTDTKPGLEEIEKRVAELSTAIDGLETCDDAGPSASSTGEMRFLFGTTRPGHTVDWITPGTTTQHVPYSCAYVSGDPYTNPCMGNHRGNNPYGNGMGRVCYREYEGHFRKVFEIFLYYENESSSWNTCEHWDTKVKEALGDIANYKWVRNNTPAWDHYLKDHVRSSTEEANEGACERGPDGKWQGQLGGLCDGTGWIQGGDWQTCAGAPKEGKCHVFGQLDCTGGCTDKCGCPAVWTAVCMDDSCKYSGAPGPFYPPGPSAGGPPPIPV